jgi:hypothetical protein
MRSYCCEGQRLYCDKSLDSVHHLGLVNELCPGTRVVILVRHVMDTVASGLEASPWGFSAYGYTPYIQANPGNAVAGLASYWLDHVTGALNWEEQHQDTCLRVRYEDLVLHPEATIERIQSFLGVASDLTVLERAFLRNAPIGPGDYKLEHTTSVHARSIGHGKSVPIGLLPPAMVTVLNERLETLGYDPLNQSWNTAERAVDLNGDGPWADRLSELMQRVRVGPACADIKPFAIVAEDHRVLRWTVEPAAGAIRQGDGEVEGVLTGTAENLVLMLTGDENLGVLLRSGRIRHVVSDETQAMRRALEREPTNLVAVLREALQPRTTP